MVAYLLFNGRTLISDKDGENSMKNISTAIRVDKNCNNSVGIERINRNFIGYFFK